MLLQGRALAEAEEEQASPRALALVARALHRCCLSARPPLPPLGLVFLYLRCARYDTKELEKANSHSLRRVIEKKLVSLKAATEATGLAAVRAHLLDLHALLAREGVSPNFRQWLQALLDECKDGPPGRDNGHVRRINKTYSNISEEGVPGGLSEGGERACKRFKVGERFSPLSECSMWDDQKRFYDTEGMAAWSEGTVPYLISSSPLLAAIYASAIWRFFHAADGSGDKGGEAKGGEGGRGKVGGGRVGWGVGGREREHCAGTGTGEEEETEEGGGECFVFELGAGCCKLGYHVARALRRLQQDSSRARPAEASAERCGRSGWRGVGGGGGGGAAAAAGEKGEGGGGGDDGKGGKSDPPALCERASKITYVMCDLSMSCLTRAMQLAEFQPLLQEGLVDFAQVGGHVCVFLCFSWGVCSFPYYRKAL